MAPILPLNLATFPSFYTSIVYDFGSPLKFIPVLIVFQKWEDFLLKDGVHFSKKGSKLVAQLLWPLIENRTRGFPCIPKIFADPKTSVKIPCAGGPP